LHLLENKINRKMGAATRKGKFCTNRKKINERKK